MSKITLHGKSSGLTQAMAKELSKILLLNGVISASLPEVISLFQRVKIPSGTITLSPGKRWNQLMVIHQGIFRLFYLDAKGKESNKGFFSEEQILAPMAQSAIEEPSLFFIETLTDVDVYVCNYSLLNDILKKYVGGTRFFYLLAADLLEEKVQREVMFLQLDARGRYEKFIADHPNLYERVPLRHLASYLGMTDVTLSRIRGIRS